jgi:CDP-diacylglycerol--serine O-phosphatidyltransferase
MSRAPFQRPFRRRDRPREVPIRRIIPNFLTTVALCSGLASIHFSLRGDLWDRAMMAIMVSAVFDLADGLAARALKVTSAFGTMLDSLSDFVAFGVAPAVLLHEWTLKDPQYKGRDIETFALAAMMLFALCSALRLARFTAATRQVRVPVTVVPAAAPEGPRPVLEGRPNPLSMRFFTGLPTPAAAAAVLIPPMIETSAAGYHLPDWLVIVFTVIVAVMMVGRQPMFSLKKIRVPRQLVVPLLVVVGLVVVAIAKFPWITISVISGGYLLTAPMSYVAHRRAMQRLSGGEAAAPAA